MCKKKHDFRAHFRRKNQTILSINSKFFELETKILNGRSNTKTVLKYQRKVFLTKKIFLEPGTFLNKQFCKNCWTLTFFYITFLNDIDV